MKKIMVLIILALATVLAAILLNFAAEPYATDDAAMFYLLDVLR